MTSLIVQDLTVVFIGDFNVNMLKENILKDCLDLNGLKNLVSDVTCVKGTPSIIDLIITNKPKRFNQTVCADTGLSDFHNIVCTSTKFHIQKLKPVTIQYRSYKNFNEDLFKHDLDRIPYHVSDIFDDVNDIYWFWNKLTLDVINEHAPSKIKKVKGKRVPYMNGNLRRAINVKNMLKRKYEKIKNSVNWNKYRNQRNVVNRLRKTSINNYVQDKCNIKGSNNKDFWNVIKPFISNKSRSYCNNIILSIDDNVYTDPAVISSKFNYYFTNIAKGIGTDDRFGTDDSTFSCIEEKKSHTSISRIKNLMNSKQIDYEFSFSKVNAELVQKHINQLKSKKATGYDMIPPNLVKLGSNILSQSICNIINMSIENGLFPDALKCAQISPIYKKDSTLEITNYRPVCVLPCISKVFERIIVNQLSEYFENIFNNVVSGFRKKHSCETVLLHMVENIKEYLDEGKIVCMMMTDLSRAFDCISYKLLIAKLHAYGLSQTACQLIFSYYENRKQQVKLGNISSEWENVYKGSAQGSVVGPVSYNIFSNDLFLILDDNVHVYNYADDNSYMCAGYDYIQTQQCLMQNVEKVIAWYEENNMKVNPDKFKYIVFGKHDNVDCVSIKNIRIAPETTVKILGLHLDNRLTFNKHISSIGTKAGRQIQVLARLSSTLNVSNRMLLYNSYMECYLNYCSYIWHFCSKKDTYKLEKLQKKALQYITQDFDVDSDYLGLLKKCNKSPLYVNRIRKMLETIFKIEQNDSPKYLKPYISNKNVIYDLRAKHNVQTRRFKTITYGQNSFQYCGAYYWNKLPNRIKVEASYSVFRETLSKWQIECKCGFCTLCNIYKM